MWEDIKLLFDSTSTVIWRQIFKNLGADIVLGLVRGIRKAVRGLVAVSDKFLAWIKAIMNKPLDIWIISKVYKRVTKGDQLTMLNLCSMLLAVPTAYVFKWLYGKKPREIPQIARLLAQIQAGTRAPPTDLVAPETIFTNLSSMQARQMPESNRLLSTDVKVLPADIPTDISSYPQSVTINAGTTEQQAWYTRLWEWFKHTRFGLWLRYLWRTGQLMKSALMCAYTAVDNLVTASKWPVIAANAGELITSD